MSVFSHPTYRASSTQCAACNCKCRVSVIPIYDVMSVFSHPTHLLCLELAKLCVGKQNSLCFDVQWCLSVLMCKNDVCLFWCLSVLMCNDDIIAHQTSAWGLYSLYSRGGSSAWEAEFPMFWCAMMSCLYSHTLHTCCVTWISVYGVAATSRIDKIISLLCKRAL